VCRNDFLCWTGCLLTESAATVALFTLLLLTIKPSTRRYSSCGWTLSSSNGQNCRLPGRQNCSRCPSHLPPCRNATDGNFYDSRQSTKRQATGEAAVFSVGLRQKQEPWLPGDFQMWPPTSLSTRSNAFFFSLLHLKFLITLFGVILFGEKHVSVYVVLLRRLFIGLKSRQAVYRIFFKQIK
jgi:hypothetical protein